MNIDRKMAMAERAMADVIDCLKGLIREQGYARLRSYAANPERMMAALEGARAYIRGCAYDEYPAPPPRNCDKYPNSMLAREAFLEEYPQFSADDEICEAFGWLYDRPRRKRRGKAAKPPVERGSFAVPGQSGVWNYAISHAEGKKPSSGKGRA